MRAWSSRRKASSVRPETDSRARTPPEFLIPLFVPPAHVVKLREELERKEGRVEETGGDDHALPLVFDLEKADRHRERGGVPGGERDDRLLFPGAAELFHCLPVSRHPDGEVSASFPDLREKLERGIASVAENDVALSESLQVLEGVFALPGLTGTDASVEHEAVGHVEQKGETGGGGAGKGGVHSWNKSLHEGLEPGEPENGAIDGRHAESMPGSGKIRLPKIRDKDRVGVYERAVTDLLQSLTESRGCDGSDLDETLSLREDQLEGLPDGGAGKGDQAEEKDAEKRQTADPGEIRLGDPVLLQEERIKQGSDPPRQECDNTGTILFGGRLYTLQQ